MNENKLEMILSRIVVFYFVAITRAIELTFELPDNADQCFFEDIKAGVDCVIEYQVVAGGQYDVDVTLEDQESKILYKGVKKHEDTFSWKTEREGTYKVAEFAFVWDYTKLIFNSYEFSTFRYVSRMSFQHFLTKLFIWSGKKETRVSSLFIARLCETKLDINLDIGKAPSRLTAMTQLDTSALAIGDRLKLIGDYQTHHRLREATGRKRAEDLNERVLLWSLGQTVVIITLGIVQTCHLYGSSFGAM
ncbi:unnamed protein product [Thelazia callipaeda]|uniref:GOLD domain-containing protein n=1 Tax=Thelazia callipaeda TaxID=103827 RepID=A0A0N5CVP6_THECL|nr:unnamed protein product [Thelazia callipaeda]